MSYIHTAPMSSCSNLCGNSISQVTTHEMHITTTPKRKGTVILVKKSLCNTSEVSVDYDERNRIRDGLSVIFWQKITVILPWCFFNYFLVSPLDTAFPLVQIYHIAVFVS